MIVYLLCSLFLSSLNKLKPFGITGVMGGNQMEDVFLGRGGFPSRPLLLCVVNTHRCVCLHFCEQVQFYFLQNGWFISVSFSMLTLADLIHLSVYILVHKLCKLYFVYNKNEIIFLLTWRLWSVSFFGKVDAELFLLWKALVIFNLHNMSLISLGKLPVTQYKLHASFLLLLLCLMKYCQFCNREMAIH